MDQRVKADLARSFPMVAPALRDVMRGLVLGRLPWPLYLHGPVGTGKTLAALCLCDVVADAVYYTCEQLADLVMEREAAWHWSKLANREFAVLDELGTRAKDSDLHYDVVKRFCDCREQSRRVAVYVSNLQPSELEGQYDARIADRMLCGQVFHLKGESRRRTKH